MSLEPPQGAIKRPMTQVTEVAAAVMLRGDPAAPEFLLRRRPSFCLRNVRPERFMPATGNFRAERSSLARRRARRWFVNCKKNSASPSSKPGHGSVANSAIHTRRFACASFASTPGTANWRRSHGELAAIEHSNLVWLPAGAAASVAPILPANAPILRALALPSLYALSNAEEYGVAAELARLQNALSNGLRLFQVRDKTLPPRQRHAFARQVMALAARHAQVVVLINDDQELARTVGAGGVHLSSQQLWQIERRPDFARVAASCHGAADLARAAGLGLDFVVLGPLLPTASHPGTAGIGWSAFTQLVERSSLPVYALGGLQPEMLETARSRGGHGIALLRGWR